MRDWRNASTTTATGPVLGLVRRASSAPVFATERFTSGPDLEPWVEYLWTVDWDLGDAEPFGSAVISAPALHLTAEWGPPGEVRHGQPMPATLVHGAVTRVFQVQLVGAGGVVGARFTAGGFPAWTGAVAHGLRDRAVPAVDLLGPVEGALHEALAGAPAAQRAGLFRAALRRHLPAASPADEELTALVAAMAADAALVRVEQVVEISGWSMRTLQRRFRTALGVTPKWVLRRFRLQEAALALESEPDVDLAGLAVRLGWYDQAHLTNDFRRMLGETPAQYAARARPVSP